MLIRSFDAAVFLASLVLIAMQVALMQALAEAQGHHFAYVVISLALLGFGSSGTILALFRNWVLARSLWLAPVLLLMTGIGCAIFLPLAQLAAARTDFPLLFVDWRAWGPMLASAGLAFIPFFLGALFLGLAFMCVPRDIGRLYAANLLGSALGAALGLILLYQFAAEQAFPLLGCIVACAAWAAARENGRVLTAACGAVFLLGVAGSILMPDLPVSAYKPVSYALRLPEAEVTADKRHPQGRLQIVESPALRHAPGLSLHFAGEIPASPHMYCNGEEYGVFLRFLGTGRHIFDHGVQALPFVLADPKRALVLHAGAGAAVGHLLSRPGVAVEVVEPHPVAAKWLREAYAEQEGRMSVTIAEGRAFLGQSRQIFDLIMLPPQGAFGGGIGLQALQENYLLTREGFFSLWSALSHQEQQTGLLSLSIHLDHPPRQSLKLLLLLAGAMRQAGIKDLSHHVAAVRGWEMLTIVASTKPFDEFALQRLEAFTQAGGFDRVWIPGQGPALEDRFHLTQDDILLDGFAAILAGDEAMFVREYLFEISAPKDSRPYFHQFIRWERLRDVRQKLGQGNLAFVEMGTILVGLTAAILASAAFVLILAPLFRLGGNRTAGHGHNLAAMVAVLGYFGAIGLGFMFLEIVWIQRFILFWGHPLYSAVGVIAALLCGMGVGSVLSVKLLSSPKTIRHVLAAILGLIVASSFLFPWLMTTGLGWSGPLKWVTGLTFLAVPAFFLGMPFPLGLRMLDATRPQLVPWAWGINGCFSVLAAPLAVLLAMQIGFGAVIGIAVSAYLLAFCTSRLTGTAKEVWKPPSDR
ncbi:MAG TPA: hypothetical protein ENN39_03770 [Desulfonatronum sp.]|nr:hypothetical protein [Desulfonatronum sp.]